MLAYTIKTATGRISCELIAAVPDGRRLKLILRGENQEFYEVEVDLKVINCWYRVQLYPGDPGGHRPPELIIHVEGN